MAVVGEEEGGEGEVVLGCALLEDLTTEVRSAGAFGENGCHLRELVCDVGCVIVPVGDVVDVVSRSRGNEAAQESSNFVASC